MGSRLGAVATLLAASLALPACSVPTATGPRTAFSLLDPMPVLYIGHRGTYESGRVTVGMHMRNGPVGRQMDVIDTRIVNRSRTVTLMRSVRPAPRDKFLTGYIGPDKTSDLSFDVDFPVDIAVDRMPVEMYLVVVVTFEDGGSVRAQRRLAFAVDNPFAR